jgi:UDP-glucose 4-epimerase
MFVTRLRRSVFAEHQIDAVIHLAGLKAVRESVQQPLQYYDNNIGSTLALCQVMAEFGVFKLVLSSSATVYGDPASSPISEDIPLKVTNLTVGRN